MLWVGLGVKDVLEGFTHKLLRVSTGIIDILRIWTKKKLLDYNWEIETW